MKNSMVLTRNTTFAKVFFGRDEILWSLSVKNFVFPGPRGAKIWPVEIGDYMTRKVDKVFDQMSGCRVMLV